MAVIRSIRGGSAGLNEEDRLAIARLLVKAGYTVKIGYRLIPGNAKGKKEYVIEYEEEMKKPHPTPEQIIGAVHDTQKEYQVKRRDEQWQ